MTMSKFTEEELNEMLYEWDMLSYPVFEYHPDETNVVEANGNGVEPNEYQLPNNREDEGGRTLVDLSNPDGRFERRVCLTNLSTDGAAHVVEFYMPWCDHCRHFKPEFISIAAEVTRRVIGRPIFFHAVSCTIHTDICRAYAIDGFPIVLGWGTGWDINERGVELNALHLHKMTADSIGTMLQLDLASEPPPLNLLATDYSNNGNRSAQDQRVTKLAHAAVDLKRTWMNYDGTDGDNTMSPFPTTFLNEVYHNAALSLAFSLKVGVYVHYGELESTRASALQDFIQLVDWASPLNWGVRTSLIRELLENFHSVVIKSRSGLVDLVDRVQLDQEEKDDELWSILETSEKNRARKPSRLLQHRAYSKVEGLVGKVPYTIKNMKSNDESDGNGTILSRKERWNRNNSKWTKACTHSTPAMGYTCGLWDLFHILTVGASHSRHQLYGFHKGYFVSPRDVARVLRNFVANFFGCDVCRWNFLDMYDQCGFNHCTRLSQEVPVLAAAKQAAVLSASNAITIDGVFGSVSSREVVAECTDKELALWLWEVHNAVNVRLMTEAAKRENRIVTEEEIKVSKFPSLLKCPNCWLDDKMERWDSDAIFDFLKKTYWPTTNTDTQMSFRAVLAGRISNYMQFRSSELPTTIGLCHCFLLFLVSFGILGALLAIKMRCATTTTKNADSKQRKGRFYNAVLRAGRSGTTLQRYSKKK